jgi:DNA-binding transcriptional MerR regulator
LPRVLAGATYLLAHEAARTAGISKATLLRWIEQNIVKDAQKRDRNGWRLFSEAEVAAIIRAAHGEK